MVSKEVMGKEKADSGMYVYCVAKNRELANFGKIGIEENEVYTIFNNELCAVVHKCKAEPYKSDNATIVKGWVKTHQKVVDEASKKFGTVIPFSFDVIIKGENRDIIMWLENEEKNLKEKLKKVQDKQEFGIQIFWDKEMIAKEAAEKNEKIKNLKKEIKQQTRGKAFFYKQKVEKLLKEEMEKIADKQFKKFYKQIKKFAEDTKVERLKESNMLLNLSCLAHKNKVKLLGKSLDKINKLKEFSVRFTGPWPPYSFV